MNDYNIRMAEPRDAKAILTIYEPYILNTVVTFEYESITEEDFRNRMQGVMKQFPWLVYEENGKILGYAYAAEYRERAAFAWDCECSIYVSEDAKHRGIATRLYEELFRMLKQQGYYNAYVLISYPNESSVSLHRKFGFHEVGILRKTGYKMGKWLDLLIMEKSLRDYSNEPVKPIPVNRI